MGANIPNDRPTPLIIGHRGASALAPENTLAAFRRAIDDGADGIEMDVRLANDNVAVVVHDADLIRTARISGKVGKMTSGQLSLVDVGTWFDLDSSNGSTSEFRGQHIPTLDETLSFLREYSGRIYIELKCKDSEVESLTAAVARSLRLYGKEEQIIVKSFKLSVIPHIKRSCPKVTTAALFAPKIMTVLRKEKHMVKIAVDFGADELSVHYSLATRKLMDKAQHRGLPVAIWTADNPRWVKRALKLGVTAIITNDPARLLKKRDELLCR